MKLRIDWGNVHGTFTGVWHPDGPTDVYMNPNMAPASLGIQLDEAMAEEKKSERS